MTIDHLFIFTGDDGKIADELIRLGFVEGSSRIHVGQGTTNRKFYFENFFLEILWVHHKQEMQSDMIKATGLWDRASFLTNTYSPFGLCLVNESDTDQLFANAYPYQPSYFPKGKHIDILKNQAYPFLPWLFRLPFKGQKKHENEPKNHPNGSKKLTKAIFEYLGNATNSCLTHFQDETQIEFRHSTRNWITLVFDKAALKQQEDILALQLTVHY